MISLDQKIKYCPAMVQVFDLQPGPATRNRVMLNTIHDHGHSGSRSRTLRSSSPGVIPTLAPVSNSTFHFPSAPSRHVEMKVPQDSIRLPFTSVLTVRYGPRLSARRPSLDIATTRGRQRIRGPSVSKKIAQASPTSALPRATWPLTKRASGSTKLRNSALSRNSAARLNAVSAHMTACVALVSVADRAAIASRISVIKVVSPVRSNQQCSQTPLKNVARQCDPELNCASDASS